METDKIIEQWRDIRGYEGLYQVSNFGRVRTVEHIVPNRGGFRTVSSKVKNATFTGQGYLSVALYKENKMQRLYVHRLVAEAFVPNPDNLPEIDHIDCVKTNNISSNLRWVDRSGNMQNPITKKLKSVNTKARNWTYENHPNAKPILQLTLDGVFIKRWDCIKTASETLSIEATGISQVVHGKRKNAGGFSWKFD